MKKLVLFILISGCFWNCNSAADNNQKESVEATQSGMPNQLVLSKTETCFLFTEGMENQDSTFVTLQISGDSVTGVMHWQPWQKDGAYGTIAATKSGDVIRGMYDYMIEGSEQKEEVMFKMTDGVLYKASGELTEELGKEVVLKLKNPDKVTYAYKFSQVDCSLFERF